MNSDSDNGLSSENEILASSCELDKTSSADNDL